ncbi:hypothetical protein JOY44_07240 [Phormidium sp. CLA17]|uniref:hypothetical protein n=1 Tax=Leptolyngbya sp. Cla-17 TaxID=2803751 RepID=UPI0014918E82|nr:hypothetical protein [Leptolyngbya sp. Cla-17]MBM0741413.1 hypothetical protein [Leptolyngbya sp. Cla-17]
MTSPTNRYRPILRLNDLLHPIQQRERAIEFSTLDEPIGPYPNYSRLWASSRIPALFLTKAPRSTTRLSEDVYFVLIKQRITWMIHTWVQTARASLAETQRMLETKLNCCETHPVDTPTLDKDVDGQSSEQVSSSKQWRDDWAETLITTSDRFSEMLSLQGVKFPVQSFDKSHPEFKDFLNLHQEVDLEAWLDLLYS